MSRFPLIALLAFAALSIALGCNSEPSPLQPRATPALTPTPTAALTPTPAVASPTPSPSPQPTEPAIPEPPERDLLDLAVRFRRAPPGTERLARQSPFIYEEGDVEEFTVLAPLTPDFRTVRAVMSRATEHAYLFFEESVAVDPTALNKAADDFEAIIYPSVTGAFGREWSPGVDSDPRIILLHADLAGIGGYFSGSDEYPRLVSPRSNEHEMIYVDAAVPPGSDGYNFLLAHEFQHMVHWNADSGEEAWVNEGLSQLAAEAVAPTGARLDAFGGAAVDRFLQAPDLQLNAWASLEDDPTPHYGASQLFFGYLFDRFGGRQRVVDLVGESADGIDGVDSYLAEFSTTFEEVFSDWIIANFLDQPSGLFAHGEADLRTEVVTAIDSFGEGEGSAAQFAADYLEIDPQEGGAVFRFDGSDLVPAVAVPPHSGDAGGAFWWSNRGDSIDSRLTRRFDLSGLDAATLRFQVWFDTEEAWDYVYVAASNDGGDTWQPLEGQHTSRDDPVGLSYGPGYTGTSGGGDTPQWLDESIDLTPFVGDEVLVRFEYVTDDSTNQRGFAVDNISIPELAFNDDAESPGGWEIEGFVRLDRPLRQRFILQLIDRQSGGTRLIGLDDENRAEVTLSGPVVIVIAAVTEVTTEPGSYGWSLAPS